MSNFNDIRHLTGSGAVAPLVATRHFAVSKSDIIVFEPSNIFVGGAGDIALVLCEGDNAITYTVPAGFIFPALAVQVLETGTDATNIVRWTSSTISLADAQTPTTTVAPTTTAATTTL